MVASVKEHPIASQIIVGGEPELTALWTDPETGLRCRTRSDYYIARRGLIVDVKTAQDAGPAGFTRAAFNLIRITGNTRFTCAGFEARVLAEHFVFLAIEKTPPFAVALYQHDEDAVSIAHHARPASTWP